MVCAEPDLLDDLLQLTAVAGVQPHVLSDAGVVRPWWNDAPLVVIGADAVSRLAELIDAGLLPRRGSVVLVGAAPALPDVWRAAVRVGAEHVVSLPDDNGWLTERIGDAANGPGRQGTVVAVLGGRGGAGATVLATALGLAGLRAGLHTLLVDADPLGGGIDLVLGLEQAPGLRWDGLVGVHGRLPSGALGAGLPAAGQMSVISCGRSEPAAAGAEFVPQAALAAPLPAASVATVLDAGCRENDLVVVDLPRAADAATRVALARAHTTLLLVPAEVRACAAAARLVAVIADDCRELRLVVRGPGPCGLGPQAVAETLGLSLLASYRSEPHVASALERGEPPGRCRGGLARSADRLLAALAPGRAA